MNTASQIGGFASALAFGYLIGHHGNYNLPFIPMAVFLAIGAWMWLQFKLEAAMPDSKTTVGPPEPFRRTYNLLPCAISIQRPRWP